MNKQNLITTTKNTDRQTIFTSLNINKFNVDKFIIISYIFIK